MIRKRIWQLLCPVWLVVADLHILVFHLDSRSRYKTIFSSVVWHLSESIYKKHTHTHTHTHTHRQGLVPTVLHDYETSAVMWCLLSSSSWQVGSLTFRQHTVCHAGDWRLHYSSSALEGTLGAEFDLSSLKTSLIRVGHSGTGHHRPRLCRERDEFSPK